PRRSPAGSAGGRGGGAPRGGVLARGFSSFPPRRWLGLKRFAARWGGAGASTPPRGPPGPLPPPRPPSPGAPRAPPPRRPPPPAPRAVGAPRRGEGSPARRWGRPEGDGHHGHGRLIIVNPMAPGRPLDGGWPGARTQPGLRLSWLRQPRASYALAGVYIRNLAT